MPLEPGEPTTLAATTTPLASSGVRTQSLADMARRSVEQKHATARDMARESLALAAQKRPSGEEAAALREAVSAVRAVEAPVTSSAPPPPPSARAVRGSLPSVPAAAQTPWSKVGLGAGVLALAAAVFLWLRHPAEPAPLVVNDVAPTAAPDKAQSPTSPTPTPGATDQTATAAPPAAVDPSTLSQEGATKTAEAAHPKGTASAAPAAVAASATASGPSPEKVVLDDDPPSPAGAEKAADKPADKALPPDPALRPADSTGGAIPVKPSTGAVQAALGAVMSGARHCVAGDEDASSAVVVFASDGHVQSVTVHGPAAGKPSGACIEGQLSRARVQPFAAASFSINATVRPD